MTSKDDDLLAPEQVAEQLKLKTQTLAIWRCTKSQPLPFLKIGSRVRYRQADVSAFIDAQRQAA